jgi:type II secretory pathway pseudopilin PulG
MNLNWSMRRDQKAFTLLELLSLTAGACLLCFLAVPALGRTRDSTLITVDLGNIRQVMVAMTLYSTENQDYLPHPTWGTIPEGPDGWAYATRNQGRLTNLISSIPSAVGKISNSNQIPFFQIGQLGPYLKSQKLLECPLDVQMRQSGKYNAFYRSRLLKLTSYGWSGAVCGFGGKEAPNVAKAGTYKLSQFKANDILQWEDEETFAFNFNDGASNPLNIEESISRRHGSPNPDENHFNLNVLGTAPVGRFGGTVDLIAIKTFVGFQKNGRLGRPNDLMCGPGFQ